MAKSTLYKIEILNWESYNQKAKKGHPCIMLSKRFLDDAKIQTLPSGGKLLYLGLLLRRGEVDTTFVIASHEDLVRLSGGSGQVVKRLLALLESLQLVTYESLYIKEFKLKEENIKEEKRITDVSKKREKRQKSFDLETAIAPTESVPIGKHLVGFYCELWEKRYGTSASFMPHHAKALKVLGESQGLQKTKELLEAYFIMPDTWVIKKRHDIMTFVNSLSQVSAFKESGKIVTNAEMKEGDRMITNMNTLNALREGKI
jgi:hypothetical protein